MSYLHRQVAAANFIAEYGTAEQNLSDDADAVAERKARDDATAADAAAERKRQVLALPEAQGKQLAAAALADTALSVDEIRAVLGKVQNAGADAPPPPSSPPAPSPSPPL